MTEKELLITNIKALTIFDANNTTLLVEECAKFLRVHPCTIKRRIHRGTIKAEFQDGKYHIPKIQFLQKVVDCFEQ